jgi:hypothetical protein
MGPWLSGKSLAIFMQWKREIQVRTLMSSIVLYMVFTIFFARHLPHTMSKKGGGGRLVIASAIITLPVVAAAVLTIESVSLSGKIM